MIGGPKRRIGVVQNSCSLDSFTSPRVKNPLLLGACFVFALAFARCFCRRGAAIILFADELSSRPLRIIARPYPCAGLNRRTRRSLFPSTWSIVPSCSNQMVLGCRQGRPHHRNSSNVHDFGEFICMIAHMVHVAHLGLHSYTLLSKCALTPLHDVHHRVLTSFHVRQTSLVVCASKNRNSSCSTELWASDSFNFRLE